MGKNKNNKKKFIIIIISLIMLTILSILLLIFLTTDMLKNNKQLFLKYAKQIYSSKGDSMISNEVISYIEKRKNIPYKDEGGLKVNIKDNKNRPIHINTNNCDIRFIGQVDNKNKKWVQDITINYSNKVNIPFQLKKLENEIGIKSKYLSEKSFTINNISKKEETPKTESKMTKMLEEARKKQMEQIIMKNIYISLNNNKFAKIENNQGYQLKITPKEIFEIEKKIFKDLKKSTDNIILESQIEEYINKLDHIIKKAEDKKNIIIKLYKNQGKLYKIEIEIDELNLKLEKLKNKEEFNYIFKVYAKKEEIINLDVKLNGIKGLDSIYEKYELKLNLEKEKYEYKLNNNLVFIEEPNIEEYNKENSINIDKLHKYQKDKIKKAIMERIEKVNKDKMEELGIDEKENPIKYMFPDDVIQAIMLIELQMAMKY